MLAVLRTAPSHTKLDALRAIKNKSFLTSFSFKLGVLISRIRALLRRAKDFGGTGGELQSNGIQVRLPQGRPISMGRPWT